MVKINEYLKLVSISDKYKLTNKGVSFQLIHET